MDHNTKADAHKPAFSSESAQEDEFNPYLPPKSSFAAEKYRPGSVWREDGQVVMEPDARLPHRCVVCNAPADGSHRLPISWTFPRLGLIFLGILFSPTLSMLHENLGRIGVLAILASILGLIVLKVLYRTRIEYGLCRLHKDRGRRYRIIGYTCLIVALLILFSFIGDMFVWWDRRGEIRANLMLILFIAGVVFAVLENAQRPSLRRYLGKRIWLSRFGAPFLDSLPSAPGAYAPPEPAKKTPQDDKAVDG